MFAGERLLDRLLALAEPVNGGIEFILVDRPKAENVAEAGSRGDRNEHTGGGELRGRLEQAGHAYGDDEMAGAVFRRAKNVRESAVGVRAEQVQDAAARAGS